MLKRENEERQRELRDLEAFVKKENAERKAAEEKIQGVLNAENEKRMKEAAALKEKMEKEKQEMQVIFIRFINMLSFKQNYIPSKSILSRILRISFLYS